MCGIAGLILAPSAVPPDAATLDSFTRSLAHRGPDGSGHTVVGRVALMHNRLSIIDLATGDQPLYAGSAALVGNGEAAGGELLLQQRLRAAVAPLAARRACVCRRIARHVRDRHP